MSNLANVPNLLSYLKENYNYEKFNDYIYGSRNKLNKYVNSEWFENKNAFEIIKKQTIDLIEIGDYQFAPFKLKLVSTKKGKYRKVCVVDIKDVFLDRLIYNYINNLIQISYRSVHSISIEVKKNINEGKTYYLRLDIKKFFESINYILLLDIIKSYDQKYLLESIKSF